MVKVLLAEEQFRRGDNDPDKTQHYILDVTFKPRDSKTLIREGAVAGSHNSLGVIPPHGATAASITGSTVIAESN